MIEAHYLFGAEYDDIEIVVHPQSIIHSMVETQVHGISIWLQSSPFHNPALSFNFNTESWIWISVTQFVTPEMMLRQDSSIIAQLGWPDMRLPILYTMSWPERIYCSEKTWPRLDFFK